ncbi:MAG: hypothetical protein C7B47_05905 [Sulfobacillus thermosulfidooxidans]|uniref:Uncharacterized protein n=1 Tax=Sulfobacillus thermosulfidooxidans TaxID=28034 RepID=A0A2T2X173_SULTH|nr:MAG: hypothetical protein C7B47_05905 [Sulfobacillus thermosulfidooxidans]
MKRWVIIALYSAIGFIIVLLLWALIIRHPSLQPSSTVRPPTKQTPLPLALSVNRWVWYDHGSQHNATVDIVITVRNMHSLPIRIPQNANSFFLASTSKSGMVSFINFWIPQKTPQAGAILLPGHTTTLTVWFSTSPQEDFHLQWQLGWNYTVTASG